MDLSRYQVSGTKEEATLANLNNRRLIAIRWVYVGFLTLVASAASILTTHEYGAAFQYVSILVFCFTCNAIIYGLVRAFPTNLTVQHAATVLQLTLDLAVAGIVTYSQGGAEARTTVMFMFPIIAAGLLFSGRMVMGMAAMSGIVYAGMILLYELHVHEVIDWAELLMPLVFYPAIFLLLAQIAVYLGRLESREVREKAYDSFLSLIAHQLKHPVSASAAIIDVINHNENKSIDPDSQRYIGMVKGENENLVRLIDNLLEAASSRKTLLKDKPVNIAELISRLAKRTAVAHMRQDDLFENPETDEDVEVLADPYRLGLAFSNIFDNAFRYSDEGTRVSYRISRNGETVEVHIRDSGTGMSEHQLEVQHERFAMNNLEDLQDGHMGGLGLGLYVAQQIIQAYGGTLELHAAEGKGTGVVIKMKGVSSE